MMDCVIRFKVGVDDVEKVKRALMTFIVYGAGVIKKDSPEAEVIASLAIAINNMKCVEEEGKDY